MDLRRLIAIVRAWFPALIAAVVLTGAAGYLVSSIQPKVYESKATMIVGQALSAINPDYAQLQVSQQLATTYAAVATTRPILNEVIKKLSLEDSSVELAKRLLAVAPLDSSFVMITAQDRSPEGAAAIANATATALIEASPAIRGRTSTLQKSLDAQLAATLEHVASAQARQELLAGLSERTATEDAELLAIDGQLVSLRSTYASLLSFSAGNGASLLTVVEPAVASPEPVSPRVLLNALLAAALGLLVVGGIAFALDHFDDSIKDAEAVENAVHLGTLGTIAKMRGDKRSGDIYRLAALIYPRSGVTEAYRTLRSNIEFASIDRPIRTLIVTSALPGEGKTVTAANLAVVFAQSGRNVLLVDADLRKPGVHQILGLPNAVGLTTLARREPADLQLIIQATEQENLSVLTTGPLPPNPAELLGSQRIRTLLDQLASTFDLVIYDSPPVRAASDAAILSSFSDGALFVIDASRGHRRAAREGREALAKAGANVIGVVLNRTPTAVESDYYGYHAGHPNTAVVADQPAGFAGTPTEVPGQSAQVPGDG